MKFAVVCDSAADLTPEELRIAQVTPVPFYVAMDGTTYRKEGVEITPSQLHQGMADHPEWYPKTSMPTITDFAEAFGAAAQQGLDVLCICLTQTFSGSYQSATTAKEMVESALPGVKIHVMDSQVVTALEGVMVMEAVRLRDHDLSLDEAVEKLEAIRETGQIFFTTKDLKYLRHGGRLNAATYIAGSMLDIKPILRFHQGDLKLDSVCRGQKKSLHRLADQFVAFVKEHNMDLRGYIFGTGVGLDCPEYQDFIHDLEQKMEENDLHPDKWIKVRIGATIGVHTGPYPVGLGFIKRCEL